MSPALLSSVYAVTASVPDRDTLLYVAVKQWFLSGAVPFWSLDCCGRRKGCRIESAPAWLLATLQRRDGSGEQLGRGVGNADREWPAAPFDIQE